MSEAKTVDLLPLLRLCVQVAGQAGQVIEKVFRSGDLQVIDKNSEFGAIVSRSEESKTENPQSAADRLAQALIKDTLSKAYPAIVVKGEEDDDMIPTEVPVPPQDTKIDLSPLPDSLPSEFQNLNTADIVIWVDPLDGTREFTQGILDAVTCLIGICYRNRPLAGVVNRPFSNETVSGVVGVGYFLHGFSAEKAAQIAAGKQRGTERRVVLTSRSHKGNALDAYIATINASAVVRAGGCGGKVLMMMEGKGDAYVFPKQGTKKWDTAAPEAILMAYGGRLTKPDNTLYTYEATPENKQNPQGLIATHCGGEFHISFCRQE